MIWFKFGPNPQKIKEVEVTPSRKDSLISFMKMFMMDNQKETTLILGRPFLNTADAHIDVGAREIRLHINGKEEKFDFRPRRKQCLMIWVKFGPNPQKIKEVEVTPS